MVRSRAQPNGYSDDGQNYSGLVEYTHFEDALNYEQGTVEHPPRNAPKPKVTDALSANTVTGFHEAIAYFAAAMDYLVKTGSTDAFSTGITLVPRRLALRWMPCRLLFLRVCRRVPGM